MDRMKKSFDCFLCPLLIAVVEQVVHNELMAQGDLYKKLFTLQQESLFRS